MRSLVVHQDVRYVRNRKLRLFDGARFLTRAISYQGVIGTCYEACAIKCPENKSAVDFPGKFQCMRCKPHDLICGQSALHNYVPTRHRQHQQAERIATSLY